MMLYACTLDLAKMATSSSACADSVEEFLPLEGAVSAVRKFLVSLLEMGKFQNQKREKGSGSIARFVTVSSATFITLPILPSTW